MLIITFIIIVILLAITKDIKSFIVGVLYLLPGVLFFVVKHLGLVFNIDEKETVITGVFLVLVGLVCTEAIIIPALSGQKVFLIRKNTVSEIKKTEEQFLEVIKKIKNDTSKIVNLNQSKYQLHLSFECIQNKKYPRILQHSEMYLVISFIPLESVKNSNTLKYTIKIWSISSLSFYGYLTKLNTKENISIAITNRIEKIVRNSK